MTESERIVRKYAAMPAAQGPGDWPNFAVHAAQEIYALLGRDRALEEMKGNPEDKSIGNWRMWEATRDYIREMWED